MRAIFNVPREVKKALKQHKRLFEKYVILNFTYVVEAEHYYRVGYYKFGKVSKTIIFDSLGNLAPRPIAEYVYRKTTRMSGIMRNADTGITQAKNSPGYVLETLYNLLEELREELGPYPERVDQDVKIYKMSMDMSLETNKKSEYIWKELTRIYDTETRMRGHADDAVYEEMLALDTEYIETIYRDLQLMDKSISSLERLKQYFENQRHNISPMKKKKLEKLIKYLRDATASRRIQILNNAIRRLETDIDGQRHQFPDGEDGVIAVREMIMRDDQIRLDRFIEQYLYNP